MNKDLSICIPTYNRADFLQGCLENIIPLAKKCNVPIYISDNASTDNTREIVIEHIKSYQFLFYSRNDKNYGPDYNFSHVLKTSESNYAWLFGDDDRLSPESIATVLGDIAKGKYDLLVVNGGRKGKDRENKILGATAHNVSKEYTDKNELLSEIGWHMTWMSCLIYGRKIINEAKFETFMNSSFLQFAVIFHYLSGKNISVYYESKPLVHNANYGLQPIFREAFEIFGRKWHKIVDKLPDDYSKEAKLKCIIDHGIKSKLFSLKFVLGMRLMGYYDLAVYKKYFHLFRYITMVPTPVMLLIALIPMPRWISSLFIGYFPNIRGRFAK